MARRQTEEDGSSSRPLPSGWKREDADDAKAKGYSPNKFYVGSKDQMGHGTTYHVKIPDYSVPRLQKVVSQFPGYDTVNDFIRDSIRHRLEWLDANYDEVMADPEQRLFDDLSKAEAMASKIKVFKSLPKQIYDACKALQEAGDEAALTAYLMEQGESCTMYPEPWRSKVMDELKRFV